MSRLRTVWAVKYADGSWRSPDHYASSTTKEAKEAKPFFGDRGKHDAKLFAKLRAGAKVVAHPHAEDWG